MGLQEIRKHTPNVLLKLFQRRLNDSNAEITQEELMESLEQLDEQVKYTLYKIELLQCQQDMLKRLIEKRELM